jgi:hypothetical protein
MSVNTTSQKRDTKLKPAEIKYPNGGGLKYMAQGPASQKLEVEAMQKKHELEIAKLKEKHASANKPKPIKLGKKNG